MMGRTLHYTGLHFQSFQLFTGYPSCLFVVCNPLVVKLPQQKSIRFKRIKKQNERGGIDS